MEINEILQKIGLSEKESRIYIALLKSGPANVSDICRRIGIHRPLIYKVLPDLIEKGIVSISPKGKRKEFTAESPEKLKGLFIKLTQDFEMAIPELEQMHQAAGKRPIVKFLQGRKGLQFVFEDLIASLKKGDVFYRYSSRKETTFGDKYLPQNYRKLRDQKQLERFVITNESIAKIKKPRLERAVKIVPPKYDLFSYDIAQLIYGNKIAFLDYNTETAAIIENPQIAEFQKKIFKLLYDKL